MLMLALFRKIPSFLTALITVHTAFGQIGIGTTTPDANAVLTIRSTGKGVLIPRLSTAEQATLAATLTTGQTGMLIADSVTGTLWVWGGTKFVPPSALAGKAPISVSSTNEISINPGTAVGDLITWDGTNWVNMLPAVQHFSFAPSNLQPYLVGNYCIAVNGIFPARSDATPFVSQIQLFGFNFAPVGWQQCNGQLLSISQNAALFSLLGTNFGGNGTSTFGLPNLQGNVPIGMGQGAGLSPFVEGQTGGSTTVTVSQ
jgi:microcystin-dependent protein